jgi:hypothetical protein
MIRIVENARGSLIAHPTSDSVADERVNVSDATHACVASAVSDSA